MSDNHEQNRCSFSGCTKPISRNSTECKQHARVIKQLEAAFEDDLQGGLNISPQVVSLFRIMGANDGPEVLQR
jgi:hypothetical protein